MTRWEIWVDKKTGERFWRFFPEPDYHEDDGLVHFDEIAPDGGAGEPFSMKEKEFHEKFWKRNN